MKIINRYSKLFIIFSILINNKILYYNLFKSEKTNIIVEVEIAKSKISTGPFQFNKGITDILPYENNGCKFISSKKVRPIKSHKIDYFYISLPKFGEKTYNKWVNVNKANKLILGPNFVPGKWFLFPNNVDWKEKRFSEIIKTIKGIAIHTNRVKNHLAKRSNTTNFIKKYKIIRQCTNLKPNNIKKFEERKIDIILFF